MGLSFLELAYETLRHASKPLTYQEIWNLATERSLTTQLGTTGKTPWQTLGSRLYVDVRDNRQSRFVTVSKNPARFFLKERISELPADAALPFESDTADKPRMKAAYHERDLHPLLVYFAYANPGFNRGRSIFTKTILHEKSNKSGYSEWIHPDVVGFYLPLDDWHSDVIEMNRLSDNDSLRLFSFEVKKSLSRGNYRESYFQAVSNSSWAHEGYLVAADVLQEDEFLGELERLTTSFGIGLIHLNPFDIDSSSVLFPARPRPSLDWETINKLCEQNSDFRKFLQDVRIDFESKRVHRSEYDEVHTDIVAYIRSQLKLEVSE
ncbi:MAG: hypothetical protein AMXMBFR47_39890 [Planctomycetota bacterium]